MSFAHPLLAAAAALSISIPILIHLLLRFRRKPIAWAAMRFLFEAYQKQRKKLRLQQLILLATRCLLLLAAGLAIARPLTAGAGASTGPRDVFIVIDNSLTSQLRAQDTSTRALDSHIEEAKKIIASLGSSDRVGVLAAANPGTVALLPPSGDHSAVAAMVDTIRATDSPADFERALRLIRGSIESDQAASPKIYILSEFRRGALAIADTPSVVFPESPIESELIGHAEATADNIQIVDIAPQRSLFLGENERTSVRVSLRRFGPSTDEPATSVVRVSYTFVNQEAGPVEAGRSSVAWAPGQTEQDVFVSVQTPTESSSIGALSVSIDRDRLPGDDTRAAPLAVSESALVGVIDRADINSASTDPVPASRWIELALQPDRSSRLQSSLLDPSDISRATLAELSSVFVLRPDLLIEDSWDILGEYVARGRGLVIFPPASLDAHAWTQTAIERLGLDLEVGAEKIEHTPAHALASGTERSNQHLRMLRSELEELLRPVRVFASLRLGALTENGEVLFTLGDGSPWVVRVRPVATDTGGGEVVFFSSALSLEWSTLAATPLMVPIMQEIVRENAGSAVRRRVTVAGSIPQLPAQVSSLVSLASGNTVLPSEEGVWATVHTAGTFAAIGQRGEQLGPLCITPAVLGGNTNATTADECLAWFEHTGLDLSISGASTDQRQAANARPEGDEATLLGGMGLSASIFLLAIALAVLETFFARRFSPLADGGRR